MQYNFDQIINRQNTNSVKYDFAGEYGKPAGLLPLWVADMDFQAPQEVLTALEATARHGIFGYADTKGDYFAALQKWYAKNFAWQTQSEWLIKTPGVVFAICAAIRALTEPGDAVLIQRPVYRPFSLAIQQNNRRLINNPLVYANGAYSIDFDDLERKIVDNAVKLLILCSPHNPVGRVWHADELKRLGDIACKYEVIIVADEIHGDFIYPGNQHHVFANLDPRFRERTITCTAPSKTFNLAGLQVSNIFIVNSKLRRAFSAAVQATGYNELNIMGITAATAAYAYGEEWLNQLRAYLTQNLTFTADFLHKRLPAVKLVKPQGTYLIWLDCSALGLAPTELTDRIIQRAKLWLDDGTKFGSEGTNFQRLNIACPRATLQRALEQLAAALTAD